MTKRSHSEAPAEELSQANKDVSDLSLGKQVYEVGFHLVPAIPEEGLATVAQKIHTVLGDAEIISEQFPVRMSLAYTVERSVQGKREKYTDAYFGFIKFALDREKVQVLQAKLRGMSEVLRFLVIETVREDAPAPRRAVFSSRQLEGETIKKPEAPAEKQAEVSEEELDKSIEALVSQD